MAEITQVKETVRPKAEAAWADRRFALVKNFVKWFLELSFRSFVCLYLALYTLGDEVADLVNDYLLNSVTLFEMFFVNAPNPRDITEVRR